MSLTLCFLALLQNEGDGFESITGIELSGSLIPPPSLPIEDIPTGSPTIGPTESPSTMSPTLVPTTSPTGSPIYEGPTTSLAPSSYPTVDGSPAPTDCFEFTTSGSAWYSELIDFCDSFSGNDKCCVGDGACIIFPVDTTMTICRGACRGHRACSYLGIVDGSYIQSYSCVGEDACRFIGGGSGSTKLTIAPNSCTGDFSCTWIGDDESTEVVNIEANACKGEDACNGIGDVNAVEINIRKGAW